MGRANQRSRLICLIGVDGSGKTTHAKGIISHLNKLGYKSKYVWFGNAYFLSYPFMIVCRMLGLTITHKLANNFVCSEHQYYKNKMVSFIWPWVQFLDAAIFVNLRVQSLLRRGFTVVCDRFVPDLLVELMTDVNDNGLYKKLVGRLLLRLMLQSTFLVSLDVDEKTAWGRKNDIPELTYLSRRRNGYRLISRQLKIPVINAERPLLVVHKEIMNKLEA